MTIHQIDLLLTALSIFVFSWYAYLKDFMLRFDLERIFDLDFPQAYLINAIELVAWFWLGGLMLLNVRRLPDFPVLNAFVVVLALGVIFKDLGGSWAAFAELGFW